MQKACIQFDNPARDPAALHAQGPYFFVIVYAFLNLNMSSINLNIF